MKKFEIGKVYGINGKAKIRVVTISKSDICFNRLFENEDGDFNINTNYEAEIVKIKKDKEGNEFIKSTNGLTNGWYAENLIDEAEHKASALKTKALKEAAAKAEADRIANAPEMKFGTAIDFTELFDYIKQFTGHANLTFTNNGVECTTRRNYWSIKWQSSEIAPAELGVFGKILSSCVVSPFNNEISNKDGVCSYWTTVHISYRHKSGGSNGMELFTARFVNGKWSFSAN